MARSFPCHKTNPGGIRPNPIPYDLVKHFSDYHQFTPLLGFFPTGRSEKSACHIIVPFRLKMYWRRRLKQLSKISRDLLPGIPSQHKERYSPDGLDFHSCLFYLSPHWCIFAIVFLPHSHLSYDPSNLINDFYLFPSEYIKGCLFERQYLTPRPLF